MKVWRCVWLRGEITSVEMTAPNLAEAAVTALTSTGSSQAEARTIVSTHTVDELMAAAERCIDPPMGGHGCVVTARSIEEAVAEARRRHPRGIT